MVFEVEAPWVGDSVRRGGAQRSVGGHTPGEGGRGGGVEAVGALGGAWQSASRLFGREGVEGAPQECSASCKAAVCDQSGRHWDYRKCRPRIAGAGDSRGSISSSNAELGVSSSDERSEFRMDVSDRARERAAQMWGDGSDYSMGCLMALAVQCTESPPTVLECDDHHRSMA